jgi:hypothetical protein
MDASSKRAALRSFAIAAAAAIAMAAGLPGLRLLPGAPLPEPEPGNATLAPYDSGGGAAFAGSKLALVAFLVLLSAIVIAASIRKIMGLNWRGVLAFLAKALGAVAGLSLLFLVLFSLFPAGAIDAPPSPERRAPPAALAASAVPSPPPAILAWAAAGIAAALAALLCLRLVSARSEARRAPDPIELEAQAARLALLRGGELKGVILECYKRMSGSLARERGIERSESMTAREFEALLEERGVPEGSVRRLTSLFESVRYGDLSPSPGEEAEALACLEEIERYARSSREGRRA